jgi:rod shape determining protein RodA
VTALDVADRRREARAARRWRHFADLDPVLLGAALGLSVIGLLLVWSASAPELAAAGADPAAAVKRQAISLLIGLVLAYGVSRVPYSMLRIVAPWAYLVGLGLLLLTLTPLGLTLAGARAWLQLPGGFTLQPSEFMKLALILLLAVVGSAATLAGGEGRTVARSLLIAGIPLALVMVQNDTGTMLVMAATAFTMIVIAGAPLRWIAGLAAAATAGAIAVVQLGLLQDYQMDRLTTFLRPDADGLAAGYNAFQARLAISGGGLFGRGLFDGPQTQGSFVPVNDSDFIFSVVGEELGLVGAAAVIGLLAVVLWRGLAIARQSDELFGRLVAVGIVAWLGFQAFENIGMNLGITPVTGVTLPFVSFGGTSIIATWVAVGVLQILHVRRRRGVLVRPGERQLREWTAPTASRRR